MGLVPLRRLACIVPACLLLVGACSSARVNEKKGTFSLPARVAEGSDVDGGASGDAATAKPVERKPTGSLPDPAALKEPNHWEYLLTYDRGKVKVTRVRLRRFGKPTPTLRYMGRFAIELWIGKELIERVRFDFPMLAAETPRTSPRRPLHEPPTLAVGATVSRLVLVPASPRATRAVLVDRATGETIDLPWPPDAPLNGPAKPPKAPPIADAGGNP